VQIFCLGAALRPAAGGVRGKELIFWDSDWERSKRELLEKQENGCNLCIDWGSKTFVPSLERQEKGVTILEIDFFECRQIDILSSKWQDRAFSRTWALVGPAFSWGRFRL